MCYHSFDGLVNPAGRTDRHVNEDARPLDLKNPHTWLRLTVVIGVLACVLSVGRAAAAQGSNAVSLMELQALARLSPSEQRRPANQARLQRWLAEQVGMYVDYAASSEAGRSKRLLSAMPDLRSILAPPSGNGSYVVLFTDVETASTFESGGTIEFPRQNVTLNGGTASTCWHEAMHAALNGRTLTVDPLPYEAVLQAGDPKYQRGNTVTNQHHVYIHALAEVSFDWLRLLPAFEREIVEAMDRQEELRAQGQLSAFNSYVVENQVWAKAHWAWRMAWEASGRKIVSVPKPFRDEFERLAGVRVPFVEEVVQFYMGGEMKIPSTGKFRHGGVPVRVPEWVMNPDKILVPALLTDEGVDPPKLVSGSWTGSINLRVAEMRRNRPPITRGFLVLGLKGTRPGVQLEASIAGRATGTPGDSGTIRVDLADPAVRKALLGGERIRLTIRARPDPSRTTGSREEVIPIQVRYIDDAPAPATPSGQKAGPLHATTEAIFLMTLPNVPAAVPGKSPSPAVGSSSAAPRPTGGTIQGGAWILEKSRTVKWDSMAQVDPSVRNRTTISVDGGNGNAQFHGELRLDTYTLSTDSAVTWTPFPAKLATRSDLKFELSLTRFERKNASDLGWVSVEIGRAREGDLPAPEWGTRDKRSAPIGSIAADGRGIVAGTDRIPKVATFVWQIDPAMEGDRFLLVARAEFLTKADIKATFQYLAEYVYRSDPGSGAPAPVSTTPQTDSPPPPSGGGTAALVRQPSPTPAPDPRVDEVPPMPGELVPIIVSVTPPPPPPARKARWFTHAEGFYRIALPPGWTVTEKEGGEERDFLADSDSAHALYSIRDHEELGRGNTEKVMSRLEARMGMEAKWRRTRRTTIVGAPALVISCFYGAGKPTFMLHYVTLFRGDRSFLIGVFHVTERPEEDLPAEGRRVLETLEFLR
jgi:hypothetical protein